VKTTDDRILLLNLTYEEVVELFSRCLESQREDNEQSRSALKKLAKALEALEPRKDRRAV
jgi:hypothetical protein